MPDGTPRKLKAQTVDLSNLDLPDEAITLDPDADAFEFPPGGRASPGGQKKLERVGALWQRQSKAGATCWAGRVNGVRILVFEVRSKRSERSPDYEVFLAPEH